jgi:hypothetical protein
VNPSAKKMILKLGLRAGAPAGPFALEALLTSDCDGADAPAVGSKLPLAGKDDETGGRLMAEEGSCCCELLPVIRPAVSPSDSRGFSTTPAVV